MTGTYQAGIKTSETGFGYTLSLIGGKYKLMVLYWLGEREVLRHNELKRHIGEISFKMLSQTLKELEAEDLIIRREYPQVPPKVEYSLTDKGQTLIPILHDLCAWGREHRPSEIKLDDKK